MTWMNDGDIDQAVEKLERVGSPATRFARYLGDWRDIVNANSDGWHSWAGGSRPASKLCELVQQAVSAERGWGSKDNICPDEKDFNKSLSPIKAAATRHGFTAPVLSERDVSNPSPRM